ncbi:hypothetical protein D7X87_24895 [bacterium D16-54]|nr:hypothetical protein D7X87_24895 [bacterium D16-54]RKJ09584.1 hypothetical protein D7X65_25100 [bacterium D16-56]
MNKKIKWLVVLFVILAIACNAEDCANLVGLDKMFSPEVGGPHAPTEPAPLVPYSEVTKIGFFEVFGDSAGGRYLVDVTATKDWIQFRCIKGDTLREREEEITEKKFECGQSVWDELMAVFENNQVNTWKEQEYYLNQYFNQQSTLFEEWPEVEFLEEGDFFNVTDSPSGYDLFYMPCYYGIDQNEKKFRSDYYGSFKLYTNHDESPSLWRAYESYGLPKGYNRFRKEFWDLIVGHTGMPDWRHELGDWGRENLYKKYPYMLCEDQERKIRYFSLLENYGGKESSMGISLVYDGGGKSILYRCFSDKKIYSVGKSGVPVLYCKRVYEPTGKLKSETEVLELPEGLPGILERYEVDKWEAETGGTEWVRQGEFYNIENAREVKNTREQELRSGYDALLHVVYTNGEHVEVQLENGRLPEAYNDFRDELWDYMIPYINEGKSEEKQVVDWREFIDQWGAEFLYETR